MACNPVLFVLPSKKIVHFKTDQFTIGRSLNSSLDVPSPFVSRNQCVIRRNGQNHWFISDLSSFKSTLVNGEAIKDGGHVLEDGDTISIINYREQEFKFYNDIANLTDGSKKRKLSEVIDESISTPITQIVPPKKVNFEEKCHNLEQEKVALTDKLRYLTILSENTQKSLSLLETENKMLRDKIQEEENSNQILMLKIQELEETLRESKHEQERIHLEYVKRKMELVDKGTEPIPVEEIDICDGIDFNDDMIDGDYYSNYGYTCFSPQQSTSEYNEPHNVAIKIDDEDGKASCSTDGKASCSTDGKASCSTDVKTHLKKEVDRIDAEFLEAENAALVSALDKKDQQVAQAINEKEIFRTNILEALEHELLCSICNEILCEAMTLNCKHTFCKTCVMEWKKKKRECPVCRTKIKHEVCNLVLDSFIDKAADILGEEFKSRRNEIKMERKDPPKVPPNPKRGKGRPPARQRADRNMIAAFLSHHVIDLRPVDGVHLPNLNRRGQRGSRGPRALVEVVDLT